LTAEISCVSLIIYGVIHPYYWEDNYLEKLWSSQPTW